MSKGTNLVLCCYLISEWFSMSPLPRLHHHDIMTIVGLFTYCQYIYIRTIRTSCNVGTLKVANSHCSRQQCIVVEWSGHSIAVRVRARVREWNFSLLSLCNMKDNSAQELKKKGGERACNSQ